MIKEEVVPLSRKQHIVLLTIIACIFQFTLFFAPALAAEAVQDANTANFSQETLITNDSMVKSSVMDSEAAKLNQLPSVQIASTTNVIASPSVFLATSSPETASTTIAVATSSPEELETIVRTTTVTMTAYNSEVGQTDDSPCITANGFDVCKHGIEDTIAANFLPMGTKVKIPDLYGDRIFIVRDRMNKKHPTRVDIWMKDRPSAMRFGVKVAKIQILK